MGKDDGGKMDGVKRFPVYYKAIIDSKSEKHPEIHTKISFEEYEWLLRNPEPEWYVFSEIEILD